MSLIKSLIQRLLDSRTTPAQAGHASKPSSAVPVDYNPSASVDNWGPVLSNSTAVSDGYIWAAGRTTSDKGFFQINTQALQITTTGTSNPGGEILNLFTPVSKGQLFSVYGRYLEQITVRLVKTIWGGVQAVSQLLLRGGGLCLKVWYSSLQRSSLPTRRNGWQSNLQFLRAIQPCSLLLPTEKTITSQCLAQGMPTCAVMVFGLLTLTGAPSLTSGLTRTGISASISTPRKANSLDMLWGLVPNSLRLISIFTRPKAVSNLVVGGASC